MNSPSGNDDVDVLEVVAAGRRWTVSEPTVGRLACCGDRDRPLAREIGAGQALRRSGQVVDRPLGDDLAPLDPRPRPEVDEVVGRAHRVLVVLDDDHGVAQPGQPAEGQQQPVVVARVQADRRLVQDIQHAHQPRADLAGQADPLGLAAGERRRRAVERQVVQADVDQERQPRADLLEQLLGDRPRDRVERRWRGHPAVVASRATSASSSKNRRDLADRQCAQLDQALAADGDGPRRGLSRAPWQSGQVMLRMNGSSCARIGPPEAPRYLASSSLATPTHFSACDQTLLLLFHRWTITRSPVPYSQARRHFSSRSRQGPLSIFPLGGPSGSDSRLAATPSNRCRRHFPISLTGPSGAIAPSQTDFDGSGTRSSGSKSWRMPRPSHAGHIPCGLLKLKSCGLGGSKPIPQAAQA